MSLDVYLMKVMPTSVFDANITHNLGKMASEVNLSTGHTLYQILWRPDECEPPFTKSKEIAPLLQEGYKILINDPDHFKQFNPENGWGSYEGLVEFVKNYRNACFDIPDADIEVSR